jgi:Skp family chaperone for outer membrane proteins
MRRLWAILTAALLSGIGGLHAQETTGATPFEVPDVQIAPAILTVDLDRLFAQSQFGQRISREYNEGRADLANENRRIAESLREEELALAAQRPEMSIEVFRSEAEAFDEKAQGIRRAQDAKERALEETLVQGRTQFLEVTRPVLGQLMVERGAFAILDRRSVVLSLGAIEITEDAIARVDEALGDGSTPEPEPQPEN